MLSFNAAPSLSLGQLQALQQQGETIFATPHLGNGRQFAIALAQVGIPSILVDQNMSTKDTLALPEYRVQGGQQQLVAHNAAGEPVLTPYLQANTTGSAYNGESVAHLHLQTLRQALGAVGALPVLQTERELQEAATVEAVLHTLVQAGMQPISRSVDERGHTARLATPNTPAMVQRYMDYKRNMLNEVLADRAMGAPGILLSNEVNILLDVVIDLMRKKYAAALGSTEVFTTVSGASMIDYATAPKFIADLNTLYTPVAAALELPQDVQVRFASGVGLAALPTTAQPERMALLDNLFHGNAAIEDTAKQFRQVLHLPPSSQAAARASLAIKDNAIKSIANTLKDRYLALATPPITQYDMLETGVAMHVPDMARDVPLGTLAKILSAPKKTK